MRIVGGAFRGRRLASPPPGVRPTSDRVRESLFAILGALDGARVLDLYSGTGALGIEALSRGAELACFVEQAGRCVQVIERNLETCGASSRARVFRSDVTRWLRGGGRDRGLGPFDLVLVDPPYAGDEAARALCALVESGVLAEHATVVVESATRHPLPAPAGLAVTDERRYGDTTLRWLTQAAEAVPRSGLSTMAETSPTRALFPASFDPLTNGHLDLIRRARSVFDEVVVAVAHNVDKKGGTFTVDERLEMLNEVLGGMDGIRIDAFHGLLVDFARKIGAAVVIRGLRAMSDFEYEFEMALMNKALHPEIEIMFMMTAQENLYVSSSRLKELASFGASVEAWVPKLVARRLREKLG